MRDVIFVETSNYSSLTALISYSVVVLDKGNMFMITNV